MRAGAYYAVAALLVLATVPMYRYIFSRVRALDRAQASPVPAAVSVDQWQRRVVGPKVWYAYDDPLPPGYKCSSAGGSVYRTREEKGATVVEPLVRSGVLVRCGGDGRSSVR